MEMLDMIKQRRSIRKYKTTPVEREKLEKIMEAALYAPNPGGRQGSKILMLDDARLIEEIGIINADCENRNWDGSSVSAEQPSIIDDLSIKSGFYGCTALGIVCVTKQTAAKVNGIGAAFVCAENMVLQAHSLGVASCIVGRSEATFAHPRMSALLDKWGIGEYQPMVFVCLGYIDGAYPSAKERIQGRSLFVGR